MTLSEEKEQLFERLQDEYMKESLAVERGTKPLKEFRMPPELLDMALFREWRGWQGDKLEEFGRQYAAKLALETKHRQ